MVEVVVSFVVSDLTRHIADRVPIDIAAKLQNLHNADWKMNDWEIRYITLRRQHRRDLAQAFTDVLPQASSLQFLVSVQLQGPCPRYEISRYLVR